MICRMQRLLSALRELKAGENEANLFSLWRNEYDTR